MFSFSLECKDRKNLCYLQISRMFLWLICRKKTQRVNSELLEFGVEALNGQAHDIEIGAFEACRSNVANPLLNAVGTGLVEGTILRDVVVDFLVGEVGERNMARDGKGRLLLLSSNCHPCDNLMRTP